MSGWLRLLDEPAGKFRAFLHKGSPDGHTRTPSIWLMPDDNRLSLRVSTVDNPDIGNICDIVLAQFEIFEI